MDRLSDVPTLPQELIDHIIDFLERDRVSLRACALVSRSWSRRPHSLLWHAISIDDHYHIPPSSSFRTMLSAAPHIRNAIHTLKTRNLLNTNRLGDLVSLLDSLPNLHSINLGCFFYCGLKGPIQPWRRTRPLRELRVDISKAFTLKPHTIDFIPIIALFSKVPVLKLALEHTLTASELSADLSWERRQLQPEEAELFKEWQLGEVDLCGEIPSISLDVIGSTQVQHLRSLTLPQIETSPMLARFITLAETVGAYVTHLRLNISRSDYESIPTSDLRTMRASLSHYSSLNTLELDWNFAGSWFNAEAFYHLYHILEHISPTLRHLVFRFSSKVLREWVKYISEGPVEDSRALETKLLSFPDLKHLKITASAGVMSRSAWTDGQVVYTDLPVSESHRTKIQQAFSTLSKIGKLKFNDTKNLTLEGEIM